LHTPDLLLALALALALLAIPVAALVAVVPLLQPARNAAADRTHAAVSPLHHLAIMPAAWPVARGRRITR
jgi:hypothetical protein